MDSTAPNHDPSSEVNIRADGRSSFESLGNVLALLDEDRSQQLLQHVVPIVSYTGTFEVIGMHDGLDPPTELCSPCRELMRNPPTICPDSWRGPTPAKHWVPYHDTLFQLIDCCFSRSGSCRLCQLLWHGIQRQLLYYRSKKVDVETSDCLGGGLKLSLRKYGDSAVSFEHNIFSELPDNDHQYFQVKMVCSM